MPHKEKRIATVLTFLLIDTCGKLAIYSSRLPEDQMYSPIFAITIVSGLGAVSIAAEAVRQVRKRQSTEKIPPNTSVRT